MHKSICFIGGGLMGGGQERAFTSLANYYAKQGINIYIILLFKTEQFYELDERIKVYWPAINRHKYHRLMYALLIIPYLRKSIKSIMPDAIISFGEWFNPFVIMATRFLNVPVFVADRMGPDLNLGIMLETAKKFFYPLANGIIAQTNYAAEVIKRKTSASKVKVIPNPVNVIECKEMVKKKQIVTLGRLSREKGHIILIKAFANVKEEEWTLHIIGDGIERENLENEVKNNGLAERVIFHGHLKNFSKIFAESEIFVLPSFYEGFPNALLEAMSVPLACISSSCNAGPSDIIQNGVNGLLVEPGNAEELASAIITLIDNEHLRAKLKTEAYKVRDRYNFDKIADQYLDFLFKTK